MKQAELDFNPPPQRLEDFDGETYERPIDRARLSRQLGDVTALMLDGQWRTLGEIAEATGGHPEASISARLRDPARTSSGPSWWRVGVVARGAEDSGNTESRSKKSLDSPLGLTHTTRHARQLRQDL